jgi:hypothetical protein
MHCNVVACDVTEVDLSITAGYFGTVPIHSARMVMQTSIIFVALFTIAMCFNDYESKDGLPYFRMYHMAVLGALWGSMCGPCAWGMILVGITDGRPQIAGANGQLTFTLKMWPCQKGKDAKLTGTISFSLSLNLFGIKINLPKIPDIQLFSANLRKPFG